MKGPETSKPVRRFLGRLVRFGLIVWVVHFAIWWVSAGLGYRFDVSGSDLQFASKSGQQYGFLIGGYDEATKSGWRFTDESYRLHRRVDRFGFFWKELDSVYVGYTYNNRHRGTDLIISPDGNTLFMRRYTEEAPIWTDALDISVDPPRTLIRGLDCCMQPNQSDPLDTDEDGLKLQSEKVVELAKSSGAYRQPAITPEH